MTSTTRGRLIAAAVILCATALGYRRLDQRVTATYTLLERYAPSVAASAAPKVHAFKVQRDLLLVCGVPAAGAFVVAAWRSSRGNAAADVNAGS